MTAHEKVRMLVKQAEEIMSDQQEMNRNGGKIRFELEGTKNMQTRLHHELNDWFKMMRESMMVNQLSEEDFAKKQEIYYSIFYSILAMVIE